MVLPRRYPRRCRLRGQPGCAYFQGYDVNNQPVYVLVLPPLPEQGGVPVHDHRDNAHGGLAFSVHHPVTQLPQMPYEL